MANPTPMLPDRGRCSRDHADAACRGLDDVVVGQNGAVGDLALSLMGGEGRTCTLLPHASHLPSAPAAVKGIGSQAVGGEVHVVLGRLPVPAQVQPMALNARQAGFPYVSSIVTGPPRRLRPAGRCCCLGPPGSRMG